MSNGYLATDDEDDEVQVLFATLVGAGQRPPGNKAVVAAQYRPDCDIRKASS